MRACFLLPTVAHGRHPKRIAAMRAEGVRATVLAFERPDQHDLGLLGDVEVLGRLEQGAYFRRLIPYLKAIPRLRERFAGQDVVHAFGVDLAGLALVAGAGRDGGPGLVVEVADIRELFVATTPWAHLARSLERHIIDKAAVLVTTAPDFASEYFQATQGVDEGKILVIENKLSPVGLPGPPPFSTAAGPLRIGYYGMLRCADSLHVLERLAREGEGRFEIVLRGMDFGIPGLAERLAAIPHLHQGGPFKSPDDLHDMHAAIDLTWVAHRHGRSNTDWSRLNRFYESGAFHRPMIGQVATPDGHAIERGGFGPVIDLAHPDEAVRSLLALDRHQVEGWARNVAAAPRSTFVYGDEHATLFRRLKVALGS